MTEEKKISKPARRSEEMQKIIEIVKANITRITKGTVNISDIEAERIIARKIIEADLITTL